MEINGNHDNVRRPVELPRAQRQQRTANLFDRLRSTEDPVERDVVREEIAELNMCIAQSIAQRYRGRGELEEDLVQVAYLGLVKSVNGFDPAYHKDFLSYAVPTISGELKKHFRDHCWTVRPPRRIQDLQHKISNAGLPADHETDTASIAEKIGVGVAEVEEALAAEGCFTPVSLDLGVGRQESTPIGDLIGDQDRRFDEAEVHVLLAPVLRELSDRDRDIVALRFFYDWTQERIAQELGVTQMRVSRIIGRIMQQLRRRLTGRDQAGQLSD